MSRFVGRVLIVLGALWLLASAFIVLRWVKGGYVVHEMSYQQFVERHRDFPEFSYVKITGGRLDQEKAVRTAMRIGREGGTQTDAFDSCHVAFVGSDRREHGIAVRIDMDEVNEVMPAFADASVTERYHPVTVEGYYSYGAGNELEKSAYEELGMDEETGITIEYGVEPASAGRRLFTVFGSVGMVWVGVMLAGKKKGSA